jgi:hypothetical protein
MTATDARPHSTVERQARPTTTVDPKPVIIPDPPPPLPHGDPPPDPVIVEYEIRRFSLAVVSRWALAVGATTLAVWWAAIALFWLAASTFGLTADVESFVQDVGFEGFRLASGPVFLALGVLGAIWVAGVMVIALVAVAAYNLYAAMLGGLRVGLVEHRLAAGPAPAHEHEHEAAPSLLVD